MNLEVDTPLNKETVYIHTYIYIYIYIYIIECLTLAQEIGVQSHIEPYQRLKKLFLMPLCLTVSVLRCGSSVSEAILGKE